MKGNAIQGLSVCWVEFLGITSYISGSSYILPEKLINHADFGLCSMFLKIFSAFTFSYSYISMLESIMEYGIWRAG